MSGAALLRSRPARRRRWWAVFVFAVMAAGLFVERRSLLAAAGAYLVVSEPPQRADAIVVLSGSIPDRILEAVDLYRAGMAPRVVLTKAPPMPGLEALRERGVALPELHEANRSVAEQLGVPAASISVVAERAASTFAEEKAAIAELRAQGAHRVILVTSKAHSRRAGLIFAALAQGDPQVIVCASRHDPFDAASWWLHRDWSRRVVIEYGKLATYLLVDQWRIR